ncbi:ABC transporter ATP-binding protein [Polymorphospora sp. NPDC050346]|uniref:ABC transporter ATP-binding protein n=1 Tax=Polymorphospora sp. NPDC050346 TaxID=3155780 RepID=UPI0033F80EC9
MTTLRTTAACVWAALRLAAHGGPALLAGYAVVTLLSGAIPAAAALLTRAMVDGLTGGTAVVGIVAALAAVGLATAVVPLWSTYAMQELYRRITVVAHGELFGAVNAQRGTAVFESPAFLNRLELARQAGDFAPGQIVQSVFVIARSVVTASSLVVSLATVNVAVAAVVLVAAVPALLAQLALSRGRVAMLALITPIQRRQGFFAGLLTTIQAAQEIRLFGAGEHLRRLMQDQQRAAIARQRAVDLTQLRVQVGLAGLAAVISGGVLVWAVVAAGRNAMSAGDVLLLVAAVAGTQAALTSAVEAIAGGHEAVMLLGHYRSVVAEPPGLPVPALPRAVPRLREGIEVRDVWFRYGDEQPWVLRGVSLTLPANRACALVGINGSGKTTLVKLLCRLRDPVRGAILWDGVDVREMDVDDLRARVGVLFQDFMRYDLTAAHNIALGDLTGADPERVADAARLAGIDATLAGLPRGYDTLLSRTYVNDNDPGDPDGGVVLSGGQWQRVALARTLLRQDPDLLVLDEPSSGLDADAEYEIHSRLREHRRGRTSLLISHRLSAIREADEIVVLAAGTVVERGSHAELMRGGGVYARLFTLQARGYREATKEDGDAGHAGADLDGPAGDLVAAP